MSVRPVIPVETVNVSLGGRSYQVVVGSGTLAGLGGYVRKVVGTGGRAFLVVDSGVPGTMVEIVATSLGHAGFQVSVASLKASEDQKTLTTLERILRELAASRHERGEPVVSVGGGVVGDIAGFAAATYRRGVPLVQCPTTLLAMVDASVGGKTGVNLLVGGNDSGGTLKKNMVGAFHQPSIVVCDVDALPSLPREEFASGFAECIKHGLLGGDWGDRGLLEWTTANARALMAREPRALVELIRRNIAIKAAVVREDEHEQETGHRGRICLNMGHTIGHVLETSALVPPGTDSTPSALRHGEAVGLGLIAEAVCGEACGSTPGSVVSEVRNALALFGLPTCIRGSAAPERILDAMFDDKKVSGGQIRLLVPTAERGCHVLTNPPREAVLAGIAAIQS